MAITRHTKHNDCGVIAVKVTSNDKDYAQLICKRHHKHIQWLSKADYESIIQLYPETIESDGVKQRPTRRPKKRKYRMQQRDGHLWTKAYSFRQ